MIAAAAANMGVMDCKALELLHLVEQPDGAGTALPVKVVPGASRDRLAGLLGDRLKVTVSRPPEKGAANRAVAALLAGALGLRPREVELMAGASSAEKTFLVRGLSAAEVRGRLAGKGRRRGA